MERLKLGSILFTSCDINLVMVKNQRNAGNQHKDHIFPAEAIYILPPPPFLSVP